TCALPIYSIIPLTQEEEMGGEFKDPLDKPIEGFANVSPFLQQVFKLADENPFAAMDPEAIKKEVENTRQKARVTDDVANKMEEAGKSLEGIKTTFQTGA